MKVEIFNTGMTYQIDRSFSIIIKPRNGHYDVVAEQKTPNRYREVVLAEFKAGKDGENDECKLAEICRKRIEASLENET